MKKIFTILAILSLSTGAFAKKVKFMVDMDTVTVNVNGIHITGDFQDEAGFTTDWDPGITPMTQVGSTSIYSIVVDIPAFRHYEFKYVNGIFGYEVEFVPQQSRVIYQFNDNRWIYIDSLANDTQVVAPVIFGTNAPSKKHLLRFRVDMQNAGAVSLKGVHVAGNFQGTADPSKCYMYSFDGKVYEYITYVDTGIPAFQHEFKYYNGNTLGNSESVPLACANVNSNRYALIATDSLLNVVCFSSCTACSGNGVSEFSEAGISVYPNPSKGVFQVSGFKFNTGVLKVYNVFGELVLEKPENLQPETLSLSVPGIYFLRIEAEGKMFSEKVVVE